MARVCWSVLVLVVHGMFVGCTAERQEPKGPATAGQAPAKAGAQAPLTAEAAKRALLEMDVGQIPPGVLVPHPKDEPIQQVNAGEIEFGLWRCKLNERTFHASALYPKAHRHKINEVSGVFEQGPDGKWVAKVTKATSGG